MRRIVATFCIPFVIICMTCACQNGDMQKKLNNKKVTAKADVFIAKDNKLNLCLYQTDTLNPLKTSAEHNAKVLSLLYDGLYSISSDFKATPNLAENVTLSPDGLKCTVTIRKNIRFSDETTLTPDDVADSINTIIQSDGYYKHRLSFLHHAESYKNKVEITLFHPVANIETLLDFPILPDGGTIGAESSDSILRHIIPGSGIFKLSRYEINKKIHLIPNDLHHSGMVSTVNNIIIHLVKDHETALKMFQNGQLDMIESTKSNNVYISDSVHNTVEYNGCRFFFLGVNSQKTEKIPESMRRLISNSIDRNELIKSTNQSGVTTTLPLHPAAHTHSKKIPYPPTDKNISGDKITTTYSLLINADDAKNLLISEKIKNALTKVNIHLKIVSVPFQKYCEKIDKEEFDFYLGETELIPNFDFCHMIKLTKTENNCPKLHEIAKDLQRNFDKTKRSLITEQIVDMYLKTQPFISLFFLNETMYCNPVLFQREITTANPYQSIPYI